MQTETVLALGYDHLVCNGNVTYLLSLMWVLKLNNPSSVHPQLTLALSLYEPFQGKKVRIAGIFLPYPTQAHGSEKQLCHSGDKDGKCHALGWVEDP